MCFLSVAVFAAPKKLVLTSPDGTIAVEASLNPSGTLIYEIKKNIGYFSFFCYNTAVSFTK
jgi:hypothetical protein